MIDVPRETRDRLDLLVQMVLAESAHQNLISAATVAQIETRHIIDSLQLLDFIPAGVLVDIGTGAGFPGLVLACCRDDPVHLVEPRARRAAFLQRAADALALSATTIWPCKIERVPLRGADVITARAVASLESLFTAAESVSTHATRWVLPKGRGAQHELDTARATWQGKFELVPSKTDPESWIVLASDVHRRRTT